MKRRFGWFGPRNFGLGLLGAVTLGAGIMVTGIAVNGITASNARAHQGATGIIKERMDLYKRNQQIMKAMGQALGASDFAAIASMAGEIEDFAAKMPEYFPEGSNQKPSEASPNIWTDFNGFKAAAAANAKAAAGIVTAANAGDAAATKAAIIAAGASCSACHKSYRMR